jgi:hypothetical protein
MDLSWKSPVVLGGAGLLFVILIASRFSGGASNSGFGLQSQAIATGANVQLAGIGAGLDAHAMDTASMVDLTRISSLSTLAGMAFESSAHAQDVALQRYAVGQAVKVNESNNLWAFKTTSANNETYRELAHVEADTRRYQIDAEKVMVPQLAEITGRIQENLMRIQGEQTMALRQQDAMTMGAQAMIRRSEGSDAAGAKSEGDNKQMVMQGVGMAVSIAAMAF